MPTNLPECRERERERGRERERKGRLSRASGLGHVFTLSKAAYVAVATTGTRAMVLATCTTPSQPPRLSHLSFAFASAVDCRAVDLCFHLDIGPQGSLVCGRREAWSIDVRVVASIQEVCLRPSREPDKNVCYTNWTGNKIEQTSRQPGRQACRQAAGQTSIALN